MSNSKSYRIRTNVNSNDEKDKVINVNLNGDYDILELLSLKIDTKNFYKKHSANYGCIVGRVIANGGVGVPNAKISVFVALSNEDSEDTLLSQLYPFMHSYDKDENQIRYNLLPDEQVKACHTPVGTFPSKRVVLDNDDILEIYDKYFKFTTRTNDAGDYMIFGVPVGDNILHTDIDISDIGHLSQRPRDMIYKGYNITQFENANKFKSDTNLDSLSQIISQNDSVYVFPFWGNENDNNVKITRNDINLQYKFEPTCIFLGSLISDRKDQGFSKKCIPTDRMGKMDMITTGNGTIEMIRKTIDGDVEEKQIQGNQLIDGNGTWCYQIPMNLDYYMTDEYGNFVPSDNPEKGIPTRTRVRFRVSLTDYESDYTNNHLAKVLVPNNPHTLTDLASSYHFGSMTNDDEFGTKDFRDLFWNNIYSVKQYIPRIQKGNNQRNVRFSGIKNINVNGGNNPIPYNNMRVNLTFMFVLQCAILHVIIRIMEFVNWWISVIQVKSSNLDRHCATLGDGICPDLENWYFAPGCTILSRTLNAIKMEYIDPASTDYLNRDSAQNEFFCITKKLDYLLQCVEINLAMEYNVIQFDFYNDWMNGLLYIPRWFVNMRKKRRFLFGLIKRKARFEACTEEHFSNTRRYTQQCAMNYAADFNGNYTKVTTSFGCSGSKEKCHKGSGRKSVNIFGSGKGGIVHTETTLSNQKAYYFKPCEFYDATKRVNLFATDIILLGSMNDCDEHGIPQVFEELTSSSYEMPTNLASTNMDNVGYMYGLTSGVNHGAVCTNTSDTDASAWESGMRKIPQTFENYKKWITKTDFVEDSIDDVLEYELTEASGIDWGYTGPNQGTEDKYSLYQPGGHFLSIGCFNAAVNIKSCVNLQRICEIGSMMSQRQHYLRKKGDDITYDFLAPNGYISKFEINDSNFRRIFATLNHNALKTVRDTNTGYLKYDFKYLHPKNFNGELGDKLGWQYTFVRNDDPSGRSGLGYKLYGRVIDTPCPDYYSFRLGINNNTTPYSKYLITTSWDGYALPQYENSYYFYFGLKDGNTAIDRFFKDFYAQCESPDEDTTLISYKIEEPISCLSSSSSVLRVNVKSVDVYKVVITDNATGTDLRLSLKEPLNLHEIVANSKTGNNFVVTDFRSFKVSGLKEGNYTLTIDSMTAILNSSVNFTIVGATNDAINDIEVNTQDFIEAPGYTTYATEASILTKYSNSNIIPNVQTLLTSYKYGLIKVENVSDEDFVGIFVANDEKYIYRSIHEDATFNSVSGTLSKVIKLKDLVSCQLQRIVLSKESVNIGCHDYFFPAWKADDMYYVYVIYYCGDGYVAKLITNTVVENKNKLPDVMFGDKDFTYLTTNKLMSDDDWANNVLNNDSLTEKQKWLFKKCFFSNISYFYPSTTINKINLEPINNATFKTVSNKVESFDTKWTDVNGNDELDEDDVVIITSSIENSATYLPNESSSFQFHFPSSYFDNDGKIKDYVGTYIGDKVTTYFKDPEDKGIYDGLKLPKYPRVKFNVSFAGISDNMRLPSIYRPLYATAVMYVDEEDGMKYAAIAANNVVTYNGEVDTCIVNGHPLSKKFRETFNGDCTNRLLMSEAITTEKYKNITETFDFTIQEGSPEKKDNKVSADSLSGYKEVSFPANVDDGNFVLDSKIKYFTVGVVDIPSVKVENYNGRNEASVISQSQNNVEIGPEQTIILPIKNSTDVYEIGFRSQNESGLIDGEKKQYVYETIKSANLLTDTQHVKNGAFNVDGASIVNLDKLDPSYFSESQTKKYAVFNCKGGNTIAMLSSIKYKIFTLCDAHDKDGNRRISDAPVTIDPEGILRPDSFVVKPTASKIVICWDSNDVTDETTITFGKSDDSISIDVSIALLGYTIKLTDKTLLLEYVKYNGSIILGCKVDSVQTYFADVNGYGAKEYLSLIKNGMIPKDYSNKYSTMWGGIFGNNTYKLVDVSSKFSAENLFSKSLSYNTNNSKWLAFKNIVSTVGDVIAICDDWTRVNEDNYSAERKKMWERVSPDMTSIAIVKFYPKDIN